MMKSNVFRRMAAMATILILATVAAVAQNIRIHVVSEGETIATIAKKYSVTKETILQINPEASRGIFPGMELQIPDNGRVKQKYSDKSSLYEDDGYSASSDVNADTERWLMSFSSGMVIGDKEDNKWDTSLGVKISVGPAYKITDNFYASFRVGYFGIKKWVDVKVDKTSVKTEANYHAFLFPLEIGYKIGTGSQFSITPFAGIEMNVGISGKEELECGKEKNKIDHKIGGKIATGAEAGLKVSFGKDIGFKLGVITPLGDKYKQWYGEGTGFVIALCSVF